VADNLHRKKPNCHETHKGGQGPTVCCSAIDDDDDDDVYAGNYLVTRFGVSDYIWKCLVIF
jgi:hypothetical protein